MSGQLVHLTELMNGDVSWYIGWINHKVLLYSRNSCNIVNQLYFHKKKSKKKQWGHSSNPDPLRGRQEDGALGSRRLHCITSCPTVCSHLAPRAGEQGPRCEHGSRDA